MNPRYLPHRPFPPYTYCRTLEDDPFPPPRAIHPVNHPQGHSYGCVTFPEDAWLWGIDLFNHGYFWEAHEAWECEWRQRLKLSPESHLLQGCIQMSAALLKTRERNLPGARALSRRGLLNLNRAGQETMGLLVARQVKAWENYWLPIGGGHFPLLTNYPLIRLS